MEFMGVIVRRYIYRFPHMTYPYSSCIYSFFAAASLLFVHLKKCFSFLFRYFFVCKKISRSINTHTGTYGHPTEAI